MVAKYSSWTCLDRDGIAYVSFFPLGGFTQLQSTALSETVEKLGATPMQVALAWLLHRARPGQSHEQCRRDRE